MISATPRDRLCLMMSSEMKQFAIGTLLFKEWPTVRESGNVECFSTDAGGEAPGTGEPSEPATRVLRISQLDAFELDGALEQLVWSQFSQCFQHFKPGLLTPFEPELKALLQLLLWRFTVYSQSATAGQTLLSIRYRDAASGARRYRPMSRRQKLGLALCTVGERWLRERSHSLFLRLPADSYARAGRRALELLTGLARAASLLNFLQFLRRGSYPTLAERALGLRAEFSKPQAAPRDVSFHYVNRELLWHGFAEFLIFLLPLVNMWKLKAAVLALFSPPNASSSSAADDSDASESANCKECGLCGEWPTMPHSIGCGHVFCYYCIKGHTIADIYFTCPRCGAEVSVVEPVRLPVELMDMRQD
ncbi:peroxisome biogenesis factor 2 isoform X1 [Alosa sapidissima]|uniref:peroxisome biogenesis factor 2 isoform X1 n=1 Tax=Alosa sapidissima TaxID=34773 RepID=UPI001C0926D7|nr:peroxisome biogenesis factor 2 isoform X1 [Alosa sapidissima]